MKKRNIKFNLVLLITLCTGVIFIYSTYAWFSSTLNVEITNFRIKTDSNSDLLISLDGITWSDYVEITEEKMTSIINDTYPMHNTQWSNRLFPVSTIGIKSNDSPYFDLYKIENPYTDKISFLNTDKFNFISVNEENPRKSGEFIAFDVFLKNSTPSPYDDYIFFNNDTFIESIGGSNMASNSVRMGFVFMDSIPNNSSVESIQNITCNGKCKSIIYEPYSTNHTDDSIEDLSKHGVVINNGYYYPTYGVIREQDWAYIWSGVYGSNMKLDTSLFDIQNTITSFNKNIYELGDEITKIRVYIWIEGQDIDCFERQNENSYSINVSLGFRKEFSR